MLVFMNDRRDKSADKKRKCKEVSGSHTMRKKRSANKKNELVQTTESPSTEDNGSIKIMILSYSMQGVCLVTHTNDKAGHLQFHTLLQY